METEIILNRNAGFLDNLKGTALHASPSVIRSLREFGVILICKHPFSKSVGLQRDCIKLKHLLNQGLQH